MMVSIFLPLIKVEDFTIEVSNNIYLLINKLQNLNTNKTADHDYIYFRIVFSALGLVSFYFLGKLIYGVLKITQFKKQFQKETFEGVNFYQTNLSEAPFSYFKNLFWKNTIVINSDIGKQILKHEMAHIEQKHSYDKIFIEIMTAVFWFNPFFHIIKKEISLIHEYLADKKAVKQSDTKAFAQMLLASHFSGKELPATSPFLSSNLKKRLKMIQKPQTKFGYARRIFALPVLFTVAFAYMVNAKNKEIAETNIEIEKAVSEIKKDTISPKNDIDQMVQRQEAKISKANEALKIQAEKLKTLSEKSKEKAAELKKIAKEKGDSSYEFELKAKELKQLSSEMDKIVEDDSVYDLEWSNVSPNGNSYFYKLKTDKSKPAEAINVQGLRLSDIELDIEKVFDSKDFKENSGLSEEKIKALKEKIKNNSDLKNKFGKANRLYINGNEVFSDGDFRIPPTPPMPPNAPNAPKPARGYTGVATYSAINRTNLSKKEIRKLEKLAKEKANLSEKQAEIARKKAEITKEQIKMQGNPWIIGMGAHVKPDVRYSFKSSSVDGDKINEKAIAIAKTYKKDGFKNLVKTDFDNDTKIYIDGKPVSKIEMNALNPSKIASINIKRSNDNGKNIGEIHVKTK